MVEYFIPEGQRKDNDNLFDGNFSFQNEQEQCSS